MDQSFYNQPSSGEQPVPPAAPAPQAAQPQQQPSQVAPTPFETPPINQAPTPPPSTPTELPPSNMQPVGMGPVQGGKSWILIIVLVVVLILGVLFFASWQGWISLGGLEKLWTQSETEVTTPVETTPESTVNANDLKRKQDLASIKDAIKKYYLANQTYPIAETVQKTSDANNALTVLVPNDIAVLPVDPLSPTNYYGYKSDGKTFALTAVLEDKSDPAGIQTGSYSIYKITDTSTETPTATTTTNTTTTDTTTTDTTTTDTTTTDTTSDGTTGATSDTSTSATSSEL